MRPGGMLAAAMRPVRKGVCPTATRPLSGTTAMPQGASLGAVSVRHRRPFLPTCGRCWPLQELENLAPDTWYVNVLAIRPQFRGAGLGTRLLAHADDIASRRGHRGLSVIVSDANRGARRLYERCGYEEAASRAMVKEAWVNEGQNWVLLMKTLG